MNSKKNDTTVDEAVVVEGQGPKPATVGEEVAPTTTTDVIVPPPITIPNPYTGTISLHIHHWQIFYVLAFFTRYNIHHIIDTSHTDACLIIDSHTPSHK